MERPLIVHRRVPIVYPNGTLSEFARTARNINKVRVCSYCMCVYFEYELTTYLCGVIRTGSRHGGRTRKDHVNIALTGNGPGRSFQGVMTSDISWTKGCKRAAKKQGQGYSCFDHLAEHFMEFSSKAKLLKWKGATPYDRFVNTNPSTVAGTNLTSVATVMINILNKGVSEDMFPEGLLCISDGEFHPTNKTGYYGSTGGFMTETATFRKKLLNAGFSKEYVKNLKFVFWNIPNGYYGGNNKVKFESMAGDENIFYMSGFDGAGLAFIAGKVKSADDRAPQTAEELFEVAMSQEVMDRVKL